MDLRVTDDKLKAELLQAVAATLAHGVLVLGPEVNALEATIASLCQKRFAVGMGSGTDSLYLAFRALNLDPGDEVITTPMTWVASTNAVRLCGAIPRFVDVREDMNINEALIEEAITPHTKAILPVHWHGKLCRMAEIRRLADKHGLHVVEDAAQAICAEEGGRRAGSFGHVNCLSMNPMKVWGAYGEAGAVVTDDEALVEKLRSLRYAGTINRENCHFPSINARIDTMQAAMLLVTARSLPQKIQRRREIARHYTDSLKDIVACPKVDDSHIFYTYTILSEDRDRLKDYLESRGVATRIRQPFLVTQQLAYRDLPSSHIPVAERLITKILSLPVHHNLTDDEITYVVHCMKDFYGQSYRKRCSCAEAKP